jgi:wyosine [tRNA(Phe)-imidazoG37] synthetase (radical SAM superfamily)
MLSPRSHHVFGPVPSRRLGRSLGVDLVPFKTCSYDCIYCQLGRTTCRTIERKEWVPVDAVLEELKAKLTCRPDYITLSGSGEPTLHSGLGELIGRIRTLTRVPVAVLTNGSLLGQPEVREAVALADVVLPSLDAPDPERFNAINRPHPEVTFERLVEGLIALREGFAGQYWLEIMLLAGYTDLPAQVRQLAGWVRRIRPDKVQLNTAVRPPTEEHATAVSPRRLAQLAAIFEPRAEVVAGHRGSQAPGSPSPSSEAVLTLLRRRPCTIEDVARGLSIKPAEVVKTLTGLETGGQVQHARHRGLVFYRMAVNP